MAYQCDGRVGAQDVFGEGVKSSKVQEFDVITVRFPSGFSVQYNNATTVETLPDGSYDIVSKEPRRWYARVPAGCLVEGINPCRTCNAAREESELALKSQIEQLRKEVRSLGRKVGKVSK